MELPIIASNEVYYLDKNMFEAHDALMCIGQKSYISDSNRIKLTNQHYYKSSDEMIELFNDLPEALENNFNLPCSEKHFFSLVKSAFQQRRKTLRNSLKAFNLSDNLKANTIFDKRPEQLSVAAFIELASAIENNQI